MEVKYLGPRSCLERQVQFTRLLASGGDEPETAHFTVAEADTVAICCKRRNTQPTEQRLVHTTAPTHICDLDRHMIDHPVIIVGHEPARKRPRPKLKGLG